VVDPKNFDEKSFVDFKGEVCIIPPNSFALARTVEYFRIPRNVLTICLGKSTYARCGIIVNVTPFEPEWEGYVTLEFSNTTPLPAKIYAGEGCAQVLFFESDEVCETSYKDRGGKYQGQRGVTLPKPERRLTTAWRSSCHRAGRHRRRLGDVFSKGGHVPRAQAGAVSRRHAHRLRRGEAAMGPFYCPGDQQGLHRPRFFDTLKNRMGAPGDFAQAYVIAHEVGHHVQNLLGITGKVDRCAAGQRRPNQRPVGAMWNCRPTALPVCGPTTRNLRARAGWTGPMSKRP
jgi:dCTP deaminase